MNAEQLKAQQAPLKDRYRQDPSAALVRFHAVGRLDAVEPVCRVEAACGTIESGLHPAAGGDPRWACSGDMLLQSLVACAGVTLRVVAIAMGVPFRSGTVRAEADCDFRGTLGVSREVPVGVSAVKLRFELDTDATPEQLDKLVQLTERYCVILQTLTHSPRIEVVRA